MKKKRFPTFGGNIYNTRSSPPALCEISPAGPEQPAFRCIPTDIIIYIIYIYTYIHNTYNTNIARVCLYRCIYIYMIL